MQFLLKTLATVAVVAAGSTVSAQFAADATIPYAEEPPMLGADADVAFIAQPGDTDANATQALDLDYVDPVAQVADASNRELQVVEGVIVGFQIAAAAAPIVAEIIKGTKKECQQLACWISTNSRTCGLSVAERVQNDITKGRDRYRYESIQSNGMWVRYWRTKFEPVDRGVIASGKCSNGVGFSVTNCQSTGRVHC